MKEGSAISHDGSRKWEAGAGNAWIKDAEKVIPDAPADDLLASRELQQIDRDE
jgi:hypothetical protein